MKCLLTPRLALQSQESAPIDMDKLFCSLNGMSVMASVIDFKLNANR